MNYTVIPKSITTLQSGSKPLDIYVWAYIKLCSKHKTNISFITEEKLSEKTNIPLRTIGRSIARLKDSGLLEVRTHIIKGEGFKKKNSYHFRASYENYFLIDNDFFHKGYTPKIGGFMLLIRALTINNTDKVLWTKIKIASEIGMNRNTVSTLINECERLGLIKAIPNGYEITESCLKFDLVSNKLKSPIYKAICDFCESKGAVPPTWDKDAMNVILTRYNTVDLDVYDEHNIAFQLNQRCKRLPKEVTLAYFVKVLGMGEQYDKLKSEKADKPQQDYSF